MSYDSLLGSRMTFYLNVPRIARIACINKGMPLRASCPCIQSWLARVFNKMSSWGSPSGEPQAPERPGLRRGSVALWVSTRHAWV